MPAEFVSSSTKNLAGIVQSAVRQRICRCTSSVKVIQNTMACPVATGFTFIIMPIWKDKLDECAVIVTVALLLRKCYRDALHDVFKAWKVCRRLRRRRERLRRLKCDAICNGRSDVLTFQLRELLRRLNPRK